MPTACKTTQVVAYLQLTLTARAQSLAHMQRSVSAASRTISVATVHHEVFCRHAALLPGLHIHSIIAPVFIFDQVDCSR